MTATAVPALARPQIRSRYRPNRTLIVGLSFLLLLIVLALFPSRIAPYDPTSFDYEAVLQPPSAAHWFGTDNFGRDIFSRVIWGTRVDLQIALFTTLVPFFLGSILGAIAGYYGGWFDGIFGMVVSVVIVFPFLVLVIAIVAFLGPGLLNMYIAVSMIGWVAYGRLVRGEMLVQKQAEYAQAAKGMGYTSLARGRQASAAERHCAVHHFLDDGHVAGHPTGRQPRLSGTGRAAADTGMGSDGGGRQELHDHGAVDFIVPRRSPWPLPASPLA